MDGQRVVVLDGTAASNDGQARVAKALGEVFDASAEEVRTFVLRDERMSHCIGCFGCWLETPGLCRAADRGRDIVRAIVRADTVVLLTPVTFGGYSSPLKRLVDRWVQVLLPFFRLYHGELHHPLRHGRFPRLVAVGIQAIRVAFRARDFAPPGSRRGVDVVGLLLLLREYGSRFLSLLGVCVWARLFRLRCLRCALQVEKISIPSATCTWLTYSGAVAGATLPLLLIEQFGFRRTLWFGALLNATIATCAVSRSRSFDFRKEGAVPASAHTRKDGKFHHRGTSTRWLLFATDSPAWAWKSCGSGFSLHTWGLWSTPLPPSWGSTSWLCL